MASSRSKDNMIEAIDLTLSSPEPEPRPRVIPHQSQMPDYMKKEPPPYRVTKPNHKASRPADTFRRAPYQAPPGNSAHIARVINSSHPQTLKTVLLELCQASPALSGALERGLAIHTIRNQIMSRDSTPEPSMKRERGESSSKGKLITPQSRPRHDDMSQTQVVKATPTVRQDAFKHHASLPVSRTKHVLPVELSGTDSDSDEDLHVPGSFPRTSVPADSFNPALSDQFKNTPITNRTAIPQSLSERLDRLEKGTLNKINKTKRCSRCHEPWTNESYDCDYHPGNRKRGEGGEIIYDCCNGPVGSTGCEDTSHVDPDKGFSFLLKRPSVSPGPSRQQQKKSRIF